MVSYYIFPDLKNKNAKWSETYWIRGIVWFHRVPHRLNPAGAPRLLTMFVLLSSLKPYESCTWMCYLWDYSIVWQSRPGIKLINSREAAERGQQVTLLISLNHSWLRGIIILINHFVRLSFHALDLKLLRDPKLDTKITSFYKLIVSTAKRAMHSLW